MKQQHIQWLFMCKFKVINLHYKQLSTDHTVISILFKSYSKHSFFTLIGLTKRAGRPRSQLVIDTWKMDFLTYLSSGLSFIVLEIDGCGSGGQGENKVAEVKDKLGKMDVKDQLDATR